MPSSSRSNVQGPTCAMPNWAMLCKQPSVKQNSDRGVDEGQQLLRAGGLRRIQVQLEAWDIAQFASARRKPAAEQRLIAPAERLVRALVQKGGVFAAGDLGDADFALGLNRTADGDGRVISQFIGRRDLRVVPGDPKETRGGAEQAALSGPRGQLGPRGAHLIVRPAMAQEDHALRGKRLDLHGGRRAVVRRMIAGSVVEVDARGAVRRLVGGAELRWRHSEHGVKGASEGLVRLVTGVEGDVGHGLVLELEPVRGAFQTQAANVLLNRLAD